MNDRTHTMVTMKEIDWLELWHELVSRKHVNARYSSLRPWYVCHEDLAAFVRKMERYSRKRCYLAIRLAPADGILSELSLKIYGSRHDSTESVIAYNALYTMGIHTNALVENTILNWVNKTVEDAFVRAKRHLRIDTTERAYDDLIYSELQRRLTFSVGVYT